jgi:isoquinoline 1-oxidoreductase alpha subunit
MSYKLTINGKAHSVDVPADMPLLWVIRDVVGLKGTKFGCGIGQCGACTVHVRGKAVRSCQTQVQAAADQAVTTLEGLSADGSHPVQIAWQDVDVPQCGYCQAGQMMSAAALLATIAKPSDADIDKAMNGNICRCGTYVRIREAIHKAASLGTARATGSSATTAPAASGERERAALRELALGRGPQRGSRVGVEAVGPQRQWNKGGAR